MSAFVIIGDHDRLEVVSDGACYDERGVILAFQSKQAKLWKLGAVIVARGKSGLAQGVGALAEHYCATFDELFGAYHSMVRRVAAEIGAGSYYDVAVAGWSTEKGMPLCSYCVGHDGPDWQAGAPFELVNDPGIAFAAGPDKAKTAFVNSDNTDGVAVIEAMRREWTAFGPRSFDAGADGWEGHGVGGFIERTVIAADGLSNGVVHAWPDDKVGERITP